MRFYEFNVLLEDGEPAAQPAATPVSGFQVVVPTSRRGADVADLQKALVAFGFTLPVHGVDGIRGPETNSAISSFQRAFGLPVSGVPDQATVDSLNKLLQYKPDVASKLTKSTDANVVKTAPTTFSGSQHDFFHTMYNSILKQASARGVPYPEIIAALGASQSSIETGYGKHAPSNNYFGIKGGSGPALSTKEFINGKMVTQQDRFRQYDSMDDSAAGYVDFLIRNSRYKPVLSASSLDDAFNAMAASGYATDPQYGNKIRGVYSRSVNNPSQNLVA